MQSQQVPIGINLIVALLLAVYTGISPAANRQNSKQLLQTSKPLWFLVLTRQLEQSQRMLEYHQ